MNLTYAIGDVHGRDDVLRPLIRALREDTAHLDRRFIFLGDIVDRGQNAKECLEIVDDTIARYPDSQLILGNHDERFWHALAGILRPDELAVWLEELGGWQSAQSYFGGFRPTFEDFTKIVHQYYDHHLDIMQEAVDKVEMGKFCLVHAGVKPGVKMADQDPHDLRWIRQEFLEFTGDFEKIIVHGHTITDSELPEIHKNRIALDSGSYRTGRISAAAFIDEELTGFICAESIEGNIVLRRFDANMEALEASAAG